MRHRRRSVWTPLLITASALALAMVSAAMDPAGAPAVGGSSTRAAEIPGPSAPAPRPAPVAAVGPSPMPTVEPLPHVLSLEGFHVALGEGQVVGMDGPLSTYTVEVDPVTQVDLASVVATVRAVLEDEVQGWTSQGDVRLQWIDDHTVANVRVVLAMPKTVDRHCEENDLATNGYYSCWDGQRAMLNLDRWKFGVRHFGDDLASYRAYLVNHEVGHGLGHGHVTCPAEDTLAPVMMQQTRSLEGCQPNGWPYPA